MYRNLHGDINIYGTSAPASVRTARTVFSQVSARLRVSAHPRFLAVNFKRPCTLTRENTVHDMYTQMKL